ncbi:MAG: hypothetical protein ABIC91_06250 [Nanoarchaeota archaeon]|nr:hypothetical protein [Nanoarchaeota archaeon]MBU1030375.1 hypothetical protein [Nanoarchaeota archaeon]MBU1850284.1 hypothetical protein [Nanoarchaeota archaeon]
MTTKKAKAEYLFEASWEVCNKVGGIYTVVKSKAYVMKQHYKNYFLIGPYFEEKARVGLDLKHPPAEFKQAFDELEEEGIKCYYGEWDADGSPNIILIDFKALISKKDEIKYWFWNNYQIDSINSHWDFEEPMLWSWAVARLLEKISANIKNSSIVGQFHEWLAGFPILYFKKKQINIATVFTTHATILGRSVAGSGDDLYGVLETMNPQDEAYKKGVADKFLTERACANNADIFTTVSEITAIESAKILGRKPEVILNNGLTLRKFPTIEETSVKHLTTRDKIREFLTYHFFPHYTFDLTHNLTFFIVGRYEFKNKGIDVMIEALAKLNEKLKTEKTKRNIAVFFWIPMGTKGLKVEVFENKNYYRHIKNYIDWHSQDILKRIVEDIVSSKTPSISSMFTEEFLQDLKKDLIQFKRQGNPSICTHYISDEKNDVLIKSLYDAGLDNKADDKVKVIVYPVYLDGNDGMINLPYYDAIAGSHLGIFPSYYEPWGYTPVETAAMGVSAVTTDLAGFGRFIESKVPKKQKEKAKGIYILKRYNRSKQEVVDDLYNIMYEFSHLNHQERVQNKIEAKNLASTVDWKFFVQNYVDAHNKALVNLNKCKANKEI